MKPLTSDSTALQGLAACLIALGMLPGCRSPAPHFEAADANRNGHVTLAEWQAHIVTTLHAENDANHDGRVTFAEWAANNPAANQRRFMSLDLDRDGAISWQEGLRFVRDQHLYDASFRTMDTNRNNTLERGEAIYYRDQLAAPSP